MNKMLPKYQCHKSTPESSQQMVALTFESYSVAGTCSSMQLLRELTAQIENVSRKPAAVLRSIGRVKKVEQIMIGRNLHMGNVNLYSVVDNHSTIK